MQFLPIRAVSFDGDGTLWDFNRVMRNTCSTLRTAIGCGLFGRGTRSSLPKRRFGRGTRPTRQRSGGSKVIALRDPRADTFPVTHSVLSAPALLRDVLPDYDIPDPVECKLVGRGLNDTYLVTTSGDRYILRVYRAGWRRDSDVQYEVDVLDHLRRQGIPVAAPIARRDGAWTRVLRAPEGRRQAVLFRYAPGQDEIGRASCRERV